MKQNEVFAKRLSQARTIKQLSMDDLVHRLRDEGIVLSKQAISKYENGDSLPTSNNLLPLSKVLDQPVEFFFREPTLTFGRLEYRKVKTRLRKKEEDSIREQAQDHFERYMELESILNIVTPSTPVSFPRFVTNEAQTDKAASDLRKVWGLSDHPISSIVELLEDNHIKIFIIEADTAFDGFSGDYEGHALICANKKRLPVQKTGGNCEYDLPRLRLTLIHEVAHIFLRFPSESEIEPKQIERLCNRFAGAFLLPETRIQTEIGSDRRRKISLYELESIKSEYGISLKAIAMRLYQCGFITQQVHRYFSVFYNQNRWGREHNEPGEFFGKEKSTRFQSLVGKALSQGVIDEQKAAEISAEPIEEIRKTHHIIGPNT